MLTNRRRSDCSGARPEIRRRHEKAGCWPRSTPFQRVGDRGDRRPNVFERRFLEPHALERLRNGAKHAAQRRIGGKRAQERLRLDQLVHVALHLSDAEEQDSVAGEEFAPVRPGDGADHVFPVGQRADQRVRRLVGCFRRRPVDDGDHEVGPLGKELIELFLLLAPGQRARQQLARVGVDGDMARDVAACEDSGDQEGGNDDPRMAGRQANDPHDRSDDWGTIVFDHGTGVKGMVRAERQWGMLRCESRRIVSGT